MKRGRGAFVWECTAPFADAKRGGLDVRIGQKSTFLVGAHSTPEPYAGLPHKAGNSGDSPTVSKTKAEGQSKSVPD